MAPPFVSVIVPTHGREDLVLRAVSSVLRQSVESIEVIVVDDGSAPPIDFPSDLRDERLRVVRRTQNCGAAAARNTGVENARGDWLAFLDSDDVWHADKLRLQLDEAARWPSDSPIAFASGWRYVRDLKVVSEIMPVDADTPARFAAGSWFNPGSTILIRRELAVRIGPQDERLRRLEDYDWFLRFAFAGGRLKVVRKSLVDVRWHRGLDDKIVRAAAAVIAREYLRPGGRYFVADKAIRRRIRSYLQLSEASAAWHRGRRVRGLTALMRSLLWYPRLQMQVEPLWTSKLPTVP